MGDRADDDRGSDAAPDVGDALGLLSRVSRTLLRDDLPVAALVHQVCVEAGAAAGMEVFIHYETHGASRVMRLAAAEGLDEDSRARYAELPYGTPFCGLVAERSARLVRERMDREPPPEVGRCVEDLRCYAGFPLVANDELLGTLAFASRARDSVGEDALRLLQAVSDQVTTRLAQHRSERRLALHASINAQSSDAIVSVDEGLRVTWLNPAAEALYGVPAAEILGRPVGALRTIRWTSPAQEGAAWAALQAAGTWRGENVHVTRDGRELVLDAVVTRLTVDGASAGMVACMRDVSERLAAERALREADRQKDAFIAMLAHELRNPLAPIRTAVGVLKRLGPDVPALNRCRDVIDRQVAHMARLLDDLLDVSRLSRGRLALRRAPMRLRDALDDALETSRPLIDERGHRLELDLDGGELRVDADRSRLTQVFANVLNNAARYSDPGGRVVVSARREGAVAVVRVRDEGVGIAPEMLERVFELFAQADDPRDGLRGGLGIGLALARQLVELHGGTIRAESDGVGRGAQFVVSLPALDAIAVETPPTHSSSPAPAVRRRVVVADDNTDAADMLALLLEARGCEVRVAYNGDDAVREAERFRPDVVLLDLGMPVVSGYEACRRIRGADLSPRPIVVALTGWGHEDDRQRTARAGFDAHLVKPVDPEALLRVMRDLDAPWRDL